jgi:hypothetical protein
MSSVRGYGRYLGMVGNTSGLIGFASIFPPSTGGEVLQDWTFQPGPPAPVEIPYRWLNDILQYRPEKPLTSAAVSRFGAGTARDRDSTAISEYGDNPFTAELHTACTADAPNLAKHVIDFYAQPGQTPRSRMSAMTIQLTGRPQAELHRILSIKQGQRLHISGAPTTWPAGMTEQIVEGISRSYNGGALITFLTSPVIGSTPGVAGPWFRVDVSAADGTDLIPF